MSAAGEETIVHGFTRVRAGFMPMVNCAVLGVAQELGFAT
jgi:ABC-type nitrate/sulfonate/bicarbonate transport system substrate-binding protein